MDKNSPKGKPHIVFQVLNFVFGISDLSKKLLPTHKLLLIALAKHHGMKGICPSIGTLAKEMNVSFRYITRCLAFLHSINVIQIESNLGRRNNYTLSFLSTDPCTAVHPCTAVQDTDPCTAVQDTPELQFLNPRPAVHPISKDNQQRLNNRERAREKPALTHCENFLQEKAEETAVWDESEQSLGELYVKETRDVASNENYWKNNVRSLGKIDKIEEKPSKKPTDTPEQVNNTPKSKPKSKSSPLSEDFSPGQESIDVAEHAGLTEEEANFELNKFMAHYRGTGQAMANWQAVLIKWFLIAGEHKRKSKKPKGAQKEEVRSTVPFFDKPEDAAFGRRGNPQAISKLITQALERAKPNGKGGRDVE